MTGARFLVGRACRSTPVPVPPGDAAHTPVVLVLHLRVVTTRESSQLQSVKTSGVTKLRFTHLVLTSALVFSLFYFYQLLLPRRGASGPKVPLSL